MLKTIFNRGDYGISSRLNVWQNNIFVQKDIHETNLEFMKKVYDNAMFLAEYLSWASVRCNDGDNLRSIDDIHEEIYGLVRKQK